FDKNVNSICVKEIFRTLNASLLKKTVLPKFLEKRFLFCLLTFFFLVFFFFLKNIKLLNSFRRGLNGLLYTLRHPYKRILPEISVTHVRNLLYANVFPKIIR